MTNVHSFNKIEVDSIEMIDFPIVTMQAFREAGAIAEFSVIVSTELMPTAQLVYYGAAIALNYEMNQIGANHLRFTPDEIAEERDNEAELELAEMLVKAARVEGDRNE